MHEQFAIQKGSDLADKKQVRRNYNLKPIVKIKNNFEVSVKEDIDIIEDF